MASKRVSASPVRNSPCSQRRISGPWNTSPANLPGVRPTSYTDCLCVTRQGTSKMGRALGHLSQSFTLQVALRGGGTSLAESELEVRSPDPRRPELCPTPNGRPISIGNWMLVQSVAAAPHVEGTEMASPILRRCSLNARMNQQFPTAKVFPGQSLRYIPERL